MMERTKSSRREFLYLGVAAAASACGGCAVFGSRKADVVAEPVQGAVHLSKDQSSAVLEPGGSLLVEAKGAEDKILVVNREGRLHGVSAVCTHMGCTVDYSKEAGRLVCPCHGSEFALDGRNVKGPAQRPLKQYDVRQENGQVVITL